MIARSRKVQRSISILVACFVGGCVPAEKQPIATTSARASAGAVAFPATSAFSPFECRDGVSFDPVGDSLTGNRERDIVGDAQYPAFYRAADAAHLFFRMRTDLDPRHPSAAQLQPSSWDVLFDADGNPATYEFMLTADGNLDGTRVRLVRNSVPLAGDPRDPANENPAQDLLQDLAPASDYYSVVPADDGSAFSGDTDFFITIAIPIADLVAAGIDVSKPIVVWGGTSAQSYALNGDVACASGFPGSLPDVDPEPGSIDPTIPDAAADVGTTPEDITVQLAVLSNDWGLTDTPVSVAVATAPAHGTAVANSDGTITYSPEPDWNGTDSFTYAVTDADVESSAATVRVTVTPVDDGPPSASDDAAVTAEDESVTTAVLANDTVRDRPATVAITAAPLNGTATVLPDGRITYTPRANWNGTDTCLYTVSDADGQSASATLTVTVAAVDDGPPVATADADATPENAPVTTAVLANDVAPDGPVIVTVTSLPSNGIAVANADHTITYGPRADWHGPDTYTYTLTDADGQSATATVTITVMDEGPPVARTDAASTTEDVASTIDVLANDVVLDGPAVVSLADAPAHGTAVVNNDGSVTYSPVANWSGTDVFRYSVADGDGQTSTAEVTIAVEPQNDPPQALDDAADTRGSAPALVDVVANDTDVEGDPLTVASFSQGAQGAVERNVDGTLTYSARDGFVGTDSFTYSVSDGNGAVGSATVTVTVAAPDAPVTPGNGGTTGPGDGPVGSAGADAFGVEGGGCASTGESESLLVLGGLFAAASCRRRSQANVVVRR